MQNVGAGSSGVKVRKCSLCTLRKPRRSPPLGCSHPRVGTQALFLQVLPVLSPGKQPPGLSASYHGCSIGPGECSSHISVPKIIWVGLVIKMLILTQQVWVRAKSLHFYYAPRCCCCCCWSTNRTWSHKAPGCTVTSPSPLVVGQCPTSPWTNGAPPYIPGLLFPMKEVIRWKTNRGM